MSHDSWNDEYSCTEDEAELIAKKGRQAVLKAAMLKLEGLKVSNLNRHGVKTFVPRTVAGGKTVDCMSIMRPRSERRQLIFDHDNCPACLKYRNYDAVDPDNDSNDADCVPCPVHQKTGHTCFAPGGFMHSALKTRNFAEARAVLRQWWRELYPKKPVPKFTPKAIKEEVA